MISARHSKVRFDTVHGVQIKEGIGCSENLQTQMTMDAQSSALGVIEKLRQLRWLSISKLTADMINTLCSFIEKMNHLESRSLNLSNERAYDGEQLNFEEASFQKIKQLVLTELHDLRMMKIERGAILSLEELRVGPCQNDLSFDIQNQENLKLLECYDMSVVFVLRLQPEGGSDFWKVKHVPTVVFRCQIHSNHYVSYKLGEPGLLNRLKRLVRTTSNVELYVHQLSCFYYDDEELARPSNAEWSDQYSFCTNDFLD